MPDTGSDTDFEWLKKHYDEALEDGSYSPGQQAGPWIQRAMDLLERTIPDGSELALAALAERLNVLERRLDLVLEDNPTVAAGEVSIEMMDLPFVTHKGKSVKLDISAHHKPAALTMLRTSVQSELENARDVYVNAKTTGNQTTVAYLMDIQGALNSRDLNNAVTIIDAMSQSHFVPSAQTAHRLLDLLVSMSR